MALKALSTSGSKTGGSLEEWRKIALDVMDNRYIKADKSTLESIEIGLRGFSEFSTASDKIGVMLKRKK